MDIQKNQNFGFEINLTGVQAASGNRTLPTGYHKGKITDCYHRKAQSGRDMIEFKAEITDSEFAGIQRTFRIMVPQNADDGVRHFWRAAMESVGYSAAQIDGQGVINVQRALFIDRPCHIHYVEGNKDAGVFDDCNLVSPETWTVGKQADMAAQAAMGSAVAQSAGLGGNVGGGLAQQATGLGAPSGGGLNAGGLGAGGIGKPSHGGGGLGAGAQNGAMSSNSLLNALNAT